MLVYYRTLSISRDSTIGKNPRCRSLQTHPTGYPKPSGIAWTPLESKSLYFRDFSHTVHVRIRGCTPCPPTVSSVCDRCDGQCRDSNSKSTFFKVPVRSRRTTNSSRTFCSNSTNVRSRIVRANLVRTFQKSDSNQGSRIVRTNSIRTMQTLASKIKPSRNGVLLCTAVSIFTTTTFESFT